MTRHKTPLLHKEQRYNITKRHIKTENSVITLKNNNIILQNNITKHKTKLLHTTQQYNNTTHRDIK